MSKKNDSGTRPEEVDATPDGSQLNPSMTVLIDGFNWDGVRFLKAGHSWAVT